MSLSDNKISEKISLAVKESLLVDVITDSR